MGGAPERATRGTSAVARPGRRVPLQDATRGALLPQDSAEAPLTGTL